MLTSKTLTRILAGGAFALLIPIGAAQAHIACDGDYQVVEGNEIYMPYCGDKQVAQKARARGVDVSNSEVRNDPATKADVCKFLRGDKSLQVDCY